jgi:hypothetical protein
MTKTEIKHNIHSLIDTVEDEGKLEENQEFVDFVINNETIEWESLSAERRASIERGLEQLNKGEKIDYEDIKKKYTKRFPKSNFMRILHF